jgi:hypothetical protein
MSLAQRWLVRERNFLLTKVLLTEKRAKKLRFGVITVLLSAAAKYSAFCFVGNVYACRWVGVPNETWKPRWSTTR